MNEKAYFKSDALLLSPKAIASLLLSDWRTLIEESDSAHDLYNVYRYAYTLIQDPDLHNLFFERIYYLKLRATSREELKNLSFIERDIESLVNKEYADESKSWLKKFINFGGKDGLQ